MSRPQLPTIDDRPEAEIVLFDGECVFCQNQVHRLNRWDWRKRLAFLSLHEPTVAEKYPDLTREALLDQMWLVNDDGMRLGGADAVRRLSLLLPMLMPLAPLMHIPGAMPLWRWAYGQDAKRRFQLAGRNCESGVCQVGPTNVPASDEKE